MRLLVDASFHTGISVGIAKYIERVVRELSQRCDVTVLTTECDIFERMGCRVIPIPYWTRTHRGRTLWELFCLHRYCTKEYSGLLSLTPIAPLFCRLPILSIVYDITPLSQRRLYSPFTKARLLVSLFTLRWAKKVLTISQATSKDLLRLKVLGIRPERIEVIGAGPGVTPEKEDCGFGLQYKPYILYVGGHLPTKNVPNLVAAFAKVVSTWHPELKLVLVGWGTEKHIQVAKRAIFKYYLEDKVVLLSNLEEKELSSLYKNAECFVFPSLYEGFGLPIVEAQVHQIPVACSFSSSLPEVAGNGAIYFDPTNPSHIALSIHLLLSRPSLCEALRRQGLENSKRFSWEEIARKIVSCFTGQMAI